MHLILALAWLAVALVLLLGQTVLPGLNLSVGRGVLPCMLAFLLSGWNFFRWQVRRNAREQRSQQAWSALAALHEKQRAEKLAEKPMEYNPEFDFTNPPKES